MAGDIQAWRDTTPGRSRNMAAIKRSNTTPERALRSALHARGFRFRKDLRLDLPLRRVRPDVVFTRQKIAVFIDGCFWHCCPVHGREPTKNTKYWGPKLSRNVERDRAAAAALNAAGWQCIRIWEHEDVSAATERVAEAVVLARDSHVTQP